MSEADIPPDQLQELKDRLTSKRIELTELIKSLSEVTGTRHDCEILDVGDSASLHEMRIRAATLMKQHNETLSEIDAVSLANCYSSRYGELIQSMAVSLPTKIIKCHREFRSIPSNFSWRVTTKRTVGAMMIVIDTKICELSLQIIGVPK